MRGPIAFEAETPLGFTVRCTAAYWEFISTIKHPVMAGRMADVIAALSDPDEIRQSRKDAGVLLFYQGGPPRWVCGVCRRDDGSGFLITAYPTDAIKAGETIWKKSR